MSDLEQAVEDHLVSECHRLGVVIWKVEILGRRGCPDRIVMPGGGRCEFVELKRPSGGVISSNQLLRHKELRAQGFKVHLLYTRAEVDDFITEVTK